LSNRELVRLEEATRHADDFSLAQGLLGQRIAWLGTSAQNHPEGFEAYKVEILGPDATVKDSALPVFKLDYRNDDGGPLFGKDSCVLFTPPADGLYIVRLRDLRRTGGPRYAYRLSVRPARPGFKLFLDGGFVQQPDLRAAGARNPNVPRGGRVPIVVSAQRIDGFMGEIQVEVQDLPRGLTADIERIRANEFQTTLVISASDTAGEQLAGSQLKIVGHAQIDGRQIRRSAVDLDSGLNVVSVVPPASIRPVVRPRRLTLQPGGGVPLEVSIECPLDFAHEVGIEVKNRPPGVFVPGRSTNAGQAIAAGERTRILPLRVDPGVAEMTFPIYVVVRFRSEQAEKMRRRVMLEQSAEYASEPIWVTIKRADPAAVAVPIKD